MVLDFQYVILNVIHSNENRLAELYNSVEVVTIQMKAIEHVTVLALLQYFCSFAVLFGSDACVTTLSTLSETVAS